MDRDLARRLGSFERVWERVTGGRRPDFPPPPPPPPGEPWRPSPPGRPWLPPPPPPPPPGRPCCPKRRRGR